MHPATDAPPKFVSLTTIVDFVGRTQAHGAPPRVAIQRAAKRYGLDIGTIRTILRTTK